MTKYAITFAATLFAATAGASDVYHGLANGNSDLFDGHRDTNAVVGAQPGIGDSFDIYGVIGRGNSDLFRAVQGAEESGPRPNIYQGFSGSPDLRY